MKKLVISFIVLVVIFGGIAVYNLLSGKKSPIMVETKNEKVPSAKEKWLKKLDQRSREFVSVIDSFRPANPALIQNYKDLEINYEEDFTNREWNDIQAYSCTWTDNQYNEESGIKISTKTFRRHIGHTYLLKVSKDELWEDCAGNEKWISYVLRYGVLLDPDTVKSRTFPVGTYVVLEFINSDCLKYAEVKYFTDHDKFSAFIYKEMESAKELWEWPEWGHPLNKFRIHF